MASDEIAPGGEDVGLRQPHHVHVVRLGGDQHAEELAAALGAGDPERHADGFEMGGRQGRGPRRDDLTRLPGGSVA